MAVWFWLLVVAVVGIRAVPLTPGLNITVISEEYADNDEEHAPGMFEGDIDLDDPSHNSRYRVALRTTTRVWTNGIVPYRISTSYSSAVARMLRETLSEMQNELRSGSRNCIQFVEWTNQRDYVYIQSRTGCSSKIGRRGGMQVISLGSNCLYRGTVKHEMMHSLAFWHEHSRVDRDSFVTVRWNNIQTGHAFNFEKHITDGDTQGQAYDYLSVMHYDAYNFQQDKSQPTLVARQRGVIMGQRRGLSPGNVREIQLKYGCAVDTSHVRSPTLPRAGAIFDCNFESNICGLTNEGTFNWARITGPTPTTGTGPTADHTSGNGYYIYAEATGHLRQSARFFYPGRLTGGVYCIMFQYWIYGSSSMQPLRVGAEVNGRRQTMINVQYSGMNYWRRSKLTLNVPYTWRLFFEVIPNTSTGDIAIDDMEVFRGRCPDYER